MSISYSPTAFEELPNFGADLTRAFDAPEIETQDERNKRLAKDPQNHVPGAQACQKCHHIDCLCKGKDPEPDPEPEQEDNEVEIQGNHENSEIFFSGSGQERGSGMVEHENHERDQALFSDSEEDNEIKTQGDEQDYATLELSPYDQLSPLVRVRQLLEQSNPQESLFLAYEILQKHDLSDEAYMDVLSLVEIGLEDISATHTDSEIAQWQHAFSNHLSYGKPSDDIGLSSEEFELELTLQALKDSIFSPSQEDEDAENDNPQSELEVGGGDNAPAPLVPAPAAPAP